MAASSHRSKSRKSNPNGAVIKENSVDSPLSSPTRKKVAICGSGVAGLGAAYALRNTDYEVHIFEKDSRLGGHTNTQIWRKGNRTTPVDTGFIVMNEATYPNFINFLKDVGVPTKVTEMSFAVSKDQGKFEWSGSGRGIFAQRRNFFRPSHWRMIFDIIRFEQYAPDLLRRNDEKARSITIGQYLDREGYSQAFKDNYLIPMTAAVWSTSPDKASLEFPAQTLVRFLWNHHLLSTVTARPDWLTIPGGSQQYIDAIVNSFPKSRLHIHTSSKVFGLRRPHKHSMPARLYWTSANGELDEASMKDDTFDHVIFACHGDQILPILTGKSEKQGNLKCHSKHDTSEQRLPAKPDVSSEEFEILSCFQTTQNKCYLHSDLSLMPTKRDTWSSWNYLIDSQPSKLPHPAGVSLTYNMNILQHIPTDKFGDVMVTMNPGHAPKPSLTQGEDTYEHPLYTVEAVRAQERLEHIQNTRGVSYCGAWTKYGFHEDGFSSGLEVAIKHLGGKVPFEFQDSTYSRGRVPAEPMLFGHTMRLVLSILVIMSRLFDRAVALPGISLLVMMVSLFAEYVFDAIELAFDLMSEALSFRV